VVATVTDVGFSREHGKTLDEDARNFSSVMPVVLVTSIYGIG